MADLALAAPAAPPARRVMPFAPFEWTVAWRYLRDDPAVHPAVNEVELAHIRTPVPGMA